MSLSIRKEKLIKVKWISGGEKALPSITHFYTLQEPRSWRNGPQRSPLFTHGRLCPTWSQLPGLTYEICQQDGQEEGGSDGGEGGAFPAAVLGGLLQLESLPGERIAGQQAGWRGVNRSWGQRVSRGGAAKQGRASRGRLKEEVPAREEERVRTHSLAVEDQSASSFPSPPTLLDSMNIGLLGLPTWHRGQESTHSAGDLGSIPGVGKILWRRAWQPTPVFLPGESPWTEEPGRLQSMGSQRLGHDWVSTTQS